MKALPLIFVALIGAAILMVQWSHRRELEEQLQSLQPEEISLSSRSRSHATSPAGISSKRESLMTGVENYVASQEGELRSPLSSDLVELLSGATAEDLQALIAGIEENHPETLKSPDPFDSGSPFAPVHRTLRLILDEMDPLAVLRSENRAESFMALARQSPGEALRWLNSSSLSEHERGGFMGLFHRLRMGKEPSKHLEHWKEVEKSSIDDFVLMEPTGVADLMPVVNLPENADLRESLISSIIFSSLMEGEGLAKSRMESLGLGTEEMVDALESSEDFGSKETLEWAIELNADSPERTLGLIDVFMGKFAVQDLAGAGEWLRKFEGSRLVRDEVTKRYAAILGSTEPEAALNWIDKIQDKQTRERMKRSTLIGWEIEDPEGFAEWTKRWPLAGRIDLPLLNFHTTEIQRAKFPEMQAWRSSRSLLVSRSPLDPGDFPMQKHTRGIEVKNGESVDRALKRLKTKLDTEGILEEMRRRRAHESTITRAIRKARTAPKRNKVRWRFQSEGQVATAAAAAAARNAD